jgi:ribosomal protein L9
MAILVVNAPRDKFAEYVGNSHIVLIEPGGLLSMGSAPPDIERVIIIKGTQAELERLKKWFGPRMPIRQERFPVEAKRALGNSNIPPGTNAPIKPERQSRVGMPRGVNPVRDFVAENLFRLEGKNASEAGRELARLASAQGIIAKESTFTGYVKTLRENPVPLSGVVAVSGELLGNAQAMVDNLRNLGMTMVSKANELEKAFGAVSAENAALRAGNQSIQQRIAQLEEELKSQAGELADYTDLQRQLEKISKFRNKA